MLLRAENPLIRSLRPACSWDFVEHLACLRDCPYAQSAETQIPLPIPFTRRSDANRILTSRMTENVYLLRIAVGMEIQSGLRP